MLKKIPNRMCIACHAMKPKRELVRIVMNNSEAVSVDFTGKAQGRGAYLCKSVTCLKVAQKGKKLEKAFKHPVSEETMIILAKAIEDNNEQ